MANEGKKTVNILLHTISIVLLSIIGTLLIQSNTAGDIDLSAVEQYRDDWTAPTYTKIDIDHNARSYDNCDSGYAPMFSATWPGTHHCCDCSNVRNTYPYNYLQINTYCDRDTEYYCRDLSGLPATTMKVIDGNIICGKAKGKSFLQSTRPDPATKRCPSKTKPCSQYTSPDNTLCIAETADPEKECPITQVVFVKNKDVAAFKARPENKNFDWDDEDFDDEYHILWTKDYDSLPFTNSAISKAPCMNPTESSIYQGFSPFAAEKGIKSCTKSVTNGLTTDPRYTNTGITVTLGELEEDNGIITQMQTLYGMSYSSGYLYSGGNPAFNTAAEMQKRNMQQLNLWTRPTLSWKLSCEADSKTSRNAMHAAVIRPYEFPDRIFVAAVFAFICVAIEACACGCGFCGAIESGSYKSQTQARAVATICSGIFVLNIIWMATTGASYLRGQKDEIAEYSIANDCGDKYTNIPVDEVNGRFDTAADKATVASYFTYGLIVTYGLSCFFIIRQVKSDD